MAYIQAGIADKDEMVAIVLEMKAGDMRRAKDYLRGSVYFEVLEKLGAGPLKALEIAGDLALDSVAIKCEFK